MIMQGSFETNFRHTMKDTISIMYLGHATERYTGGRTVKRRYTVMGIVFSDPAVVFAEILGLRYAKRTQIKTRWCHHKNLITLRTISATIIHN
jgi:hypothetical protein